MKTAKFLLVFAACAVLYRVFEPVYQAETPYSRSEFEQVSSFLLYKRQHLKLMSVIALSKIIAWKKCPRRLNSSMPDR